MKRNLTLLEKQKVRVYSVYIHRGHISDYTSAFYNVKTWKTIYTQELIQHTRVIYFALLSLPQVFKSPPNPSQGVTHCHEILVKSANCRARL